MPAHLEAMEVYDLEVVIADCIDMAKSVQRLVVWHERCATQGRITDYFAATKFLLELIADALSTCTSVAATATTKRAEDWPVDRAQELSAEIDRLSRIKDEIHSSWPAIDMTSIERSWAQYENGHSQSAREILDELRRSRSG